MAADPSSRTRTPTVTEPAPAGPGSRSGGRLVWTAAIALLAFALIGGRQGPSGSSDPPAAASVAGAPTASASSDAPGSDAPGSDKHLFRSRPTRLSIPKISVDAPFTSLALGHSGRLQPPPADNTNLVGWYSDGVSPGEAGTAIIAGHVDTVASAAVFAELGELKPGDRFTVERADGTKPSFVVDSAETFAKDDFPSERVYADTPRAEVRLITCAGDYDRTVKDYMDNLVVFAHLV
ncbi:class F sortase [Streptomyces sp. NPDC046915]|uniref:class F sortase n=1 Tax=Streptomyces sp. NPDC046915 TaxID=3155257 RepID=UPI0033FE9C9A